MAARVTLVLLDGAHPEVFGELVERGDLPHISLHLLSAGSIVPATTVFPSTSNVAYLPFLTGCYPGTCDIPGIRWLDVARYGGRWWRGREHVRSYCGHQGGRINDDLSSGIRTIFDVEPDSIALCTPFRRGLPQRRVRTGMARAVLGAAAHFTGRYRRLDRVVGRTLVKLLPQQHRFTFAVFPGIDGVAHHHDARHPRVLDLYREFDDDFGAFARGGGMDGDALFMLVSDHGMSAVERHTDIALELEAMGIPTLRHPLLWRGAPRAAVMVSGNSSAHVYLRPGDVRDRRVDTSVLEAGGVAGVPADLIDAIASLPGVGLVASVEGEAVVVTADTGRALLVPRDDGVIEYDPSGGDVLGLGAGAARHERDWLTLSHASPWPDSPMQLLQLFRSRRAGDLVVAAAPGADLRDDWELPEHHSGHGSLHGDHMRCVVAANRAWQGPIRTADLYPAVLRHLGHPVPDGIDGVHPDPPASRLLAHGPDGILTLSA